MPDLNCLPAQELQAIESNLMKRYQEFKSRRISLDMTRGKPCPAQLDLSLEMLDCLGRQNYLSEDGIDCRNYGGLDGVPEAKRLFAQYLEVEPDEVILGGNASLNLMHDTLTRAMLHGVLPGQIPWNQLPRVKFLCPSPGYDRHFSICEHLGIEMIPVEMQADGPAMDQVEELAGADETIKGIWCVPKYSNPTGAVYSDEVVERLAALQTRATDFRILWDNAYAVHHLGTAPAKLKNILAACKEAGNPERVFVFGSTSKITFAGAGVAVMAGSVANMEFTRKHMAFQTIGPDKLNQLRHVRFFKSVANIEDHMGKHAAILKPKFDAVQNLLEKELGNKNIAEWSKPAGGYFVSINTMNGCARAVVEMAAAAGVKLTPAGATFPYQNDPLDRNIRIAPSFPPLEDIRSAMELVGICIQRVSIEKILGQR
ncbi:MAG: aminotransferase class I/II-fold pyridoxal phosphate-dependent enzyme [Desulfobacterales bacterium]|nr:MAG: aminotransferase class I/II-fold pyridoxal phosphate-dependent enzyme [Desulfobacterales bacterium]